MTISFAGLTATEIPMETIHTYVPKLQPLRDAAGWFRAIECPAGSIKTLFLRERADFEFAIRAILHKGEPVDIPASMGASFINGLWDRPKIAEYVAGFPTEEEGMEAVMADKANFKTQLIILSDGPYSAVGSADIGLADDEWREKSLVIRLYHELSHFVCRTFYSDRIDALRDETVADMAGIVGAFGRYDTSMALRFFGVMFADCCSATTEQHSDQRYSIREGGRLLNYLSENDDEQTASARVSAMVSALSGIVAQYHDNGNVLEMIASPAFQDDIVSKLV